MRTVVYALAWIGSSLVMLASVVGLAIIVLSFLIIGPLAPVYVAARLSVWFGLNMASTIVLMVAGLWLFGSVRLSLYRPVLRSWRCGLRILWAAKTLRDGLWRQYRDGDKGEVPS